MENTESYLIPQVTVEGTTLVSKGFPEGTITVDTMLTYVGGETFILYEVARCEIHLYAEADERTDPPLILVPVRRLPAVDYTEKL
jgi:hypothetical protein